MYVDLAMVEKRHALCTARLELMGALGRDYLAADTPPAELVQQLRAQGLVEVAVSLASKLEMDLTDTLVDLTDRCLQLQGLKAAASGEQLPVEIE